jgi:acylpyruvate hydrolase
MKVASIGEAGRERPVFVSDDGGRFLPARGTSWKTILVRGDFEAEVSAALGAREEDWHTLPAERFGPPIPEPTKIVAIGLNYRAHAAEQGKAPPEVPLLFAKAPSCLIGAGDAIRIPQQEEKVDAEGELCVVIGAIARRVSRDRASRYILGYTIMNDVSGRGAQYGDKQWFRGKSFDTFGPCGPWIVPAGDIADPHALGIRVGWNGTTMQESNTSDLIHNAFDLVSYISHQMTLMPGDLIATGTPSGVGVFRDPPVFLKAGDRVRIEIDGIGVLENPVEAG